ncbi:MAG TPA: hypothetical protein VJM51_05455, partial [Dehalococcoidia bacterium]|nr:hypothetical protein [Dehalococcoidia bacterium]
GADTEVRHYDQEQNLPVPEGFAPQPRPLADAAPAVTERHRVVGWMWLVLASGLILHRGRKRGDKPPRYGWSGTGAV